MRIYSIPHTDLRTAPLAYGCMNLAGVGRDQARRAVMAARELGINLFDHADIYGGGESEAFFGDVLATSPGLRHEIILQSKCGIRLADTPTPGTPKRYDLSYVHLVTSVEGSLRRLKTDYLDILLLHRPDPLAEPEEVARAFDHLQASGKVRHFGVSNHAGFQVDLLRRYLRRPLVVNQLELSLAHAYLIEEGLEVNRAPAIAPGAGTLDHCRSHGLLVQAWAPLAGGRYSATDARAPVSACLEQLAAEHRTSPEAILLAWLLRHPAGIQPLIGSTRPERIRACGQALDLTLSREAWYALLEAERGEPVP